MLQHPETTAPTPGFLACLAETRIGPSTIFGETRTEPLPFVRHEAHRTSTVSWPEVASDLCLYTQSDPIGLVAGGVNLYAYALENPVRRTDPTGLLPISVTIPIGITIFAGCAEMAFDEGNRLGQHIGYRYGHCMAACSLTRLCGIPRPVVFTLGVANEVKQTLQCFFMKENCHSAFAPVDFSDNRRGFECPPKKPCEEACEPLLTTPSKTPGQYGPFTNLWK